MSNNKDFKVRNGIQPTSYFEGLGTVVSGTEGYYLAGGSYDSVSLSITSQTGSNAFSIDVSSDGTKVYAFAQLGTVFQYTLSTAWDLSTATYSGNSFEAFTGATGTPNSVRFGSNGTKMYIISITPDTIYQYTLSTAWDVSTASYDSITFVATSQDTSPTSFYFKSDGTKLYILGNANDTVYQYSVSTAWNVSTASYDSVSFALSGLTTSNSLTFKSDGTEFFVMDNSNDTIYGYNLSAAWDLSTASASGTTFNTTSQDTASRDIAFKSDGTKMYVIGSTGDSIYQYSTALNTATLDLSTGSVFEVTPTSDIQVTLSNPADSGTVSGATLLLEGGVANMYDLANASYSNKSLDVSAQITGSMGLKGITFNSAGTSFYILTGDAGVSTNDAIYQYTLTTAFDLSTGSYASKTLNVGTRETTPTGLAFNTDGTKLFIIGYNDDLVETWNLSTGYDISTASYASKSFNISSQEGFARHINFNNDGTKMYITGNGSSRVQEYALSTAFDVTTASFTDNFNPTSQASAPFITLFNNDGTKMYVQNSTGVLYQYSLSTAFDVSTGSYDSVSFTPTEGGGYQGAFIGNSGLNLYSASSDDDKVYQYSTATPATITYDPVIQWSAGTAPTSPAIGETDVITFSTRDGGTTYQAVVAIDGAA
jgi:sugar lactone lactonase YvrE